MTPAAIENSPSLRFAIGDTVIYTNDYGLEFTYRITGFYRNFDSPLYAMGARYYVDSSSPWYPVQEDRLTGARP